ncbi:MAG: response regulator [Actinomycetota bacterium]
MVSTDAVLRQEARFGFPDDFELCYATDARDARGALDGTQPALVIVDLRSGNAGGFVVARELDQVSKLADVPVLMLLQRPQDSWLAGQAGADLYRTKPIDTADLVADALSLIA